MVSLLRISWNATITCSSICAGKGKLLSQFYSSNTNRPQNHNQGPSTSSFNSLIGSPSRVQKLIAFQPDALLAKEIFDFTSSQPGFSLPYTCYHVLIQKLARAKHFSLVEDLLIHLKSGPRPIAPALFSGLIKVYADANMPDKALWTFHTMIEFNCQPLPKHLNRILEVLVSHRSFIRPAFDLFKDAHRHGVFPNTRSYNILMRAFCLNGDLSIAYSLFNQMFKREVLPNIETYKILMQGLCRKSQVNRAVELLEDMLNKGFVPDALTYNTLLNSLCRKTKLREAYKLLCRMKVKGCNPDILHYNTVIQGFCREGHAADACKVLVDMSMNGCLPNLVSYCTLVCGLCEQGMLDEAKTYIQEMMEKGFSPHFSISHGLIRAFCNVGKIEEACEVVEQLLKHGAAPHSDSWSVIVPLTCENNDKIQVEIAIVEILRVKITGDTRLVDAISGLDEYLSRKAQHQSRRPRIS